MSRVNSVSYKGECRKCISCGDVKIWDYLNQRKCPTGKRHKWRPIDEESLTKKESKSIDEQIKQFRKEEQNRMFEAIKPDIINGIKKGDLRWIWLKGVVREVRVKSTYNDENGICIDYETKTTAGTAWVDISQLFRNREVCIKEHLSKMKLKSKKMIENIKSRHNPKLRSPKNG